MGYPLMTKKYDKDFLKKLRSVTGKRPKTVIDHILKHGHITTEELRDIYGYGHPPRAVKDVTDLGIPVERFNVKGKDGRTIAAYTFGDPSQARSAAHGGRTNFPKAFKRTLIELYGNKCALCAGTFDSAYLQIDHRIPYDVAGQSPGEPNPQDYMLVCRTCNRGKSWSCEHCPNGLKDKKPDVCQSCYWAFPTKYQHVAMQPIRRLDLEWSGEEIKDYDQLRKRAGERPGEMPDFVKKILRDEINKTPD